jgi:two-component system sporulation sensor kinase C
LVVSDIISDPRNISPSSIRDKWRSYAGVPIISKGKVLGVMILTSRQENYFKPEHLGLLNHIGNHIGVAVENAQAYEMARRAENDLRQSEQRFHQMAEVIPAIFWMYSADLSRLIYVSPAYDKIFGHPLARLYEKPDLWIDYVHPEDRDRVLSNKEKYPGEDYEMEYRIIRPDGSVRWIYARIFPIRDEFGDIQNIAGLSEDITERKDAEEQIRRYNEELEEIVEKRTARIRELERQRAEIEKLVATGRMATRIAHEINNPLAGIKNSFLLIKDAIPDEHPHYEYVGLIEKEIERIAWIVRQMFDLYRPDQDPVRMSPVQEVINDVAALLDSSCREYGVSIEINRSDVSTHITIQDALLRQILYNIIQNGIEASSPGGVVTITVDFVEASLIIRISDQGVGIPEEARFRIFEPFFTTKSSLTNGGLGLGLSVSKSIIEAMGGSIDFESRIGKGTTFTVTLPIESERSEVRNV